MRLHGEAARQAMVAHLREVARDENYCQGQTNALCRMGSDGKVLHCVEGQMLRALGYKPEWLEGTDRGLMVREEDNSVVCGMICELTWHRWGLVEPLVMGDDGNEWPLWQAYNAVWQTRRSGGYEVNPMDYGDVARWLEKKLQLVAEMLATAS